MNIYVFLIMFVIPAITLSQDSSDDYYKVAIFTGEKPDCISSKSLTDGKLDNFLKIDASGATDVVVKIINNYNEECIRCDFISGGSVHYINNIPEGIYYLKIAYGYDWSKKVIGSFCFAKFMRDAHYQIGNDLLDYYVRETHNGYQIPSYELVLKVISNNRRNEFNADEISEEEFYR